MKKIFPKLSSLIISLPSRTSKRATIKSSQSNQYVDKEQFVNLITEKMLNSFKKEDSEILGKSISYILKTGIEIKNNQENNDNLVKLTKNHIFGNFSEKSKKNGDVVFFQPKPQNKKSSLKKKSRNSNNFPSIKKTMNLDITNINNNYNGRNKFDKKYLDVKYENEPTNYKIKNIKRNSIINNFITFSNTTQPDQINMYSDNSSNSKKSNGMNNSSHSNKSNKGVNAKSVKKKLFPLCAFSHNLHTERLKTIDNKNNMKKANIRRSYLGNKNYSINFIKKMEKIKTEINLEQRKKNPYKNKRQSDITKIAKTQLNLNGMIKNSSKNNKRISTQMKANPKLKEIELLQKKGLISNSSIEAKNFDIFNFEAKVGKENTLYLIGLYIYKKCDFSKIIKEMKFANWSKKIASGYSRLNPYHTDLHAADVSQTCFLSLLQEGVKEISKVDNVDICALILSCMCHDFKHGGLNNNFLKLTKHKLAIKYNDISILENMHISETFKLINSNPECDIFSGVEKATYEKMRKKMISCVLSTDMFYHHEHTQFMKDFIAKKNVNSEDNQQFMNLLIHSADISNPTKPFNIYLKWAKLVFEEFCQQGDKEKALGLVCSCDRNSVNLRKNQIGFIDYVVDEFVSNFIQVFPNLKFLHDNLVDNREKLLDYKDEENYKKSSNNKKLIRFSINFNDN